MKKLDFDHLQRHAERNGVDWNTLDLTSPIDRQRPFLDEALTPLYHTDVYAELSPEQALRYNQLTGMSFNEVISFFEVHFAQKILHALMKRGTNLPTELVDAMARFAEEERQHTEVFRALNRLSEPDWYNASDHYILRPNPMVERAVGWLTGRPEIFPAVIWIALVMEEKSLTTSRALIRAGKGIIEPHYLEVHRAHLLDEIRHVHIDWHMLDHVYSQRPGWLRRANAQLFSAMLTHFFLTPARAGKRVVEILLQEHPALQRLEKRIFLELGELRHNPDYHHMMYSREVTPIAFSLFDRFEEFRPLGERLISYTPALEGGTP